MLQFIDVTNENGNINKFNAAAKQAHEHPETHGLLVKIYADWCSHCQNMKTDWKRLIHELKTNYRCKKPGCVLTIANIRAVNLEQNDPVVQKIKYIPKDIQGVPLIMYVNKGTRGLEYSKERVYSEMLKWVIEHPDFGLVRKNVDKGPTRRTLRTITKKAHIKFKEIHRDTLKQFHKEMKRQHKKSVKTRMPTPIASQHNGQQYIPAYLRE
jgi:thiol-disulfide isomerase/thioredoxin